MEIPFSISSNHSGALFLYGPSLAGCWGSEAGARIFIPVSYPIGVCFKSIPTRCLSALKSRHRYFISFSGALYRVICGACRLGLDNKK